MSELIRITVKDADSTEEYLIKAFEKSKYKIKNLDPDDIKVQNAQRPGQLIARGEGTVEDQDGNVIIKNKEIYSRLLLNEKDEGVVVYVRDNS